MVAPVAGVRSKTNVDCSSGLRVVEGRPNRRIAIETPPLEYDLAGSRVTVAVRDPALLADVARLFRSYAVHPAAPRAPDARRVDVRTQGGGYVIEGPAGAPVVCRTRLEAIEGCEWVLTTLLLAALAHHVHVHAAGLVRHDRAALIPGEAGTGKSSLAFAWSRRGHPVLGDDVVVLDASGRAGAVRRFLKLDPRALAAAGVAPEDTPFWAPGSAEAWYEPEGAAAWADPTPVGLLVLPTFARDAEVHVRPRSRREGLNALLTSVLRSGRSPAEAFDRLFEIARSAETVALTFGAAADAVRALEDLLA